MSEPNYQPIPASDYERAVTIAHQSYDGDPAHMRRWLPLAERPSESRGMYLDGQLVSQLELYQFEMMAGRTTIPIAGIGAVATPPEHRRRGYVGAMLRAALGEMRERGLHLALLGAFKESFYGRYGWAIFSERRVYTAAPAQFAPFLRKQGQFVPVGPESIAELDSIYRGALRGRVGPLMRNPAWWRNAVLGSAYWQRQHHAFLWRDEQGQGRAYLIYRMDSQQGKDTLQTREIVALDPVARAQLFGFLAGFDGQVDLVRFRAPADAPVNLLFPDPLESGIELHFMARVVDVAALLTAYPYPKDVEGRLTIAITDDLLAHNQGVFELEVAGGVGQVRQLPADTPAGVACDVRVLGQLVSRLLRPRVAAAFGMLAVSDRAALDLAETLFAGLVPFVSDGF
jgi:predicted acetyltransferase